jgi:CheY-like chemotaxis protein
MNVKQLSVADAPADLTGQRPRVLVVDDDWLIRRLNAEILSTAGYDVDVAEDGGEAWDALQCFDYDLLLTDNQMPKMSGLELVQRIREARLDLPVIMATSAFPGAALNGIPAHRPDIILLKPYTPPELLGTVAVVMEAALNGNAPVVVPNWESQPLAFGVRLS